MSDHGLDVFLKNLRKLAGSVLSFRQPFWILLVPDQGVAAHLHSVPGREIQNPVRLRKIERLRSRMPSPNPRHKAAIAKTNKISARHFMWSLPLNSRRFTLPQEGTSAKDIAHTAVVTLGSKSCRLRRSARAFH